MEMREGARKSDRFFLNWLSEAKSSGGCPKTGRLNLCCILSRVPFSGPTAFSPLSYLQFWSCGTAP